MKPTPQIDASAAFPDPMHLPGERDLADALGPSFDPVSQVLATLRHGHPRVSTAWQYSPRGGWYRLELLGKRRLLYLLPKRGDFRMLLILGGKALAGLQAGPHRAAVARLLQTARRYPEGTAFEFDRHSLDPGLVAALLEAKISPGAPSR